MEERLQKYMADCGIASRRKCEEIILQGRVKVNNALVKELGVKIDRDIDKVYVDNKLISAEENKIYIALNKPTGYLSTVEDDRGRKTILDLVKVQERVYPIGRLDNDTSGLILLTNDGDVYNRVIHPRKEVNKIYIAEITGSPTEEEIKRFCSGIDIGDYITAPAKLMVLEELKFGCRAEITIHEGKNRQVRRMCEAINHPVTALKRKAVGRILLGNLKEGTWRFLNKSEIDYLKSL